MDNLALNKLSLSLSPHVKFKDWEGEYMEGYVLEMVTLHGLELDVGVSCACAHGHAVEII